MDEPRPTPLQDPIALELFRNALDSIADEMALTIYRTAYSNVIRDVMDTATALCDASGQTIVQGLTIPVQLGAMPEAMASILHRYEGRIDPEDVFLLNDPYEGGMHLPDIFVFKPIFVDETLTAWAATICHHTDVGGRVAGSNAADSTEIFQEGLRIPASRLYERGTPNETLFRIIEKNVRAPDKVFGDLRAQLAACHTGEVRFLELVKKHGLDVVRSSMDGLLAYTERLTRAAIADLPDGAYAFEDFIDDDGVDVGQPIPIRVAITVAGDRLIVDWSGSSKQVRGAINSTYSYTKGSTYVCVKSVLSGDIPCNEGFFRCVEVIAPPGTITNPVEPGACAARGLTGFRLFDACFGAFAQMLPDRIFAATDGGHTGISIGGYDRARRPFIYVDFFSSAWGGRPWADGLDGNCSLQANVASQPVEVCEREHPIRLLRYEFIPDSGGPGKFRGGMSVRRDYQFLEEDGTLQIRSDRAVFRPYGLYGGLPGRASRNVANPATSEERRLPSKFTLRVRHGDVVRHEQAGAGGWGDPLERLPSGVLKDVRNGLVSLASAERDYGVVVDADQWSVDVSATEHRRAQLREARGTGPLPTVTR